MSRQKPLRYLYFADFISHTFIMKRAYSCKRSKNRIIDGSKT